MSKVCVLLVAHGSRDPLADSEMKKLTAAYQIRHPDWAVRFGYLELANPSFQGALEEAAKIFNPIQVLPLFLFQGSHLKKDIPEMIQTIQKKHPSVQLWLGSSLGLHPALIEWVLKKLRQAGYPPASTGETALVVGHGTREPESKIFLEELVAELRQKNPTRNLESCFIGAGHPSLKEKMEELKSKNRVGRLWISPYLLFPGNFLEKIDETLRDFQNENPSTEIFVASSLGADDFLFQILDARLAEVLSKAEKN
jgi:sirohydrochlorin ferrochelatase